MVRTARSEATRTALGPTLIRLCREGLDIVCVDADLGYSTSAVKFGRQFPERFFTVGVREDCVLQHLRRVCAWALLRPNADGSGTAGDEREACSEPRRNRHRRGRSLGAGAGGPGAGAIDTGVPGAVSGRCGRGGTGD